VEAEGDFRNAIGRYYPGRVQLCMCIWAGFVEHVPWKARTPVAAACTSLSPRRNRGCEASTAPQELESKWKAYQCAEVWRRRNWTRITPIVFNTRRTSAGASNTPN